MEPHMFDNMYTQAKRFCGPFVTQLIQQAGFKHHAMKEEDLFILDNACGTGTVAEKIISSFGDTARPKLDLTCADISDAMVEVVRERIRKEKWSGTRALKADAQDTSLPSSYFTHIFWNFGPMVLPHPLSGLRECYRMMRPGGILGFTTWKFVPWCDVCHEALAQNPDLPDFPLSRMMLKSFSKEDEHWDNAEEVKEHLERLEFVDVEVNTVEHVTELAGIEELQELLQVTFGNAVAMLWTEDEVTQYRSMAEENIMKYARKKYAGGPIVWRWVAILATGRKPE